MDSSDADAEWSDEDVVKSGSVTAFSDTDVDEDGRDKGDGKVSPAKSLDPVDEVLNKIDAQLKNIHSSKTIPKLSKLGQISPDISPVYMQVYSAGQSDQASKHANISSPANSNKSGNDTGVGSLNSEPDPNVTPRANMHETKKEAVETLDRKEESLADVDVDQRFQEILERKKGVFLEELQNPIQSDQETVKTEDFENRFNECLVFPQTTDVCQKIESEFISPNEAVLKWLDFKERDFPKQRLGDFQPIDGESIKCLETRSQTTSQLIGLKQKSCDSLDTESNFSCYTEKLINVQLENPFSNKADSVLSEDTGILLSQSVELKPSFDQRSIALSSDSEDQGNGKRNKVNVERQLFIGKDKHLNKPESHSQKSPFAVSVVKQPQKDRICKSDTDWTISADKQLLLNDNIPFTSPVYSGASAAAVNVSVDEFSSVLPYNPKQSAPTFMDDDTISVISSLPSLQSPDNVSQVTQDSIDSIDLEAEFEKALAKISDIPPTMPRRSRAGFHQRSFSGSTLDLLTSDKEKPAPRQSLSPPGRRRKKESIPSPDQSKPPVDHASKRKPDPPYLRTSFQTINSSGYNSDLESVKTEDFENIFQNLLVKNVAEKSTTEHLNARTVAAALDSESNLTNLLKLYMKDKPLTSTGEKAIISNIVEKPFSLSAQISSGTVKERKAEKPSPKMPHKRQHFPERSKPLRSLEQSTIERRCDQTDSQTDNNEHTDEELARNAAEVERESIKIQKELEFERKLKSPQKVPKVTIVKSFDTKSVGVNKPDETIDSNKEQLIHLDKKKEELTAIEHNITCCRGDLKQLERLIRESQEKAEDARTQLSLTEFKRDNIGKEVEKSTQELYAMRQKLKVIDQEVKVKVEEMKELSFHGIVKDEIMEVIKKGCASLSKSQDIDRLQLERNELARQVEKTKEDLFSDRKLARQQKELLEEMDGLKGKLEEVQNDRDLLHQRMVAMEMNLQKVEGENRKLEKERRDIEKDFKEKVKKEAFDFHRETVREKEVSNARFGEMASEILKLEGAVQLRDDAIANLRNQVELGAAKLHEEQRQREIMMLDHRKTLQSLKKDTDLAMTQLKESCFLEKQHALETLRDQLHEEQRGALVKTEDRMTLKLAELEKAAADKDDQLQQLDETIRQLQDTSRQNIDKIKRSTEEQIQLAVANERKRLDDEREKIKSEGKEEVRTELNTKISSLTEELEHQRSEVKQLDAKAEALKKDLEKEKVFSQQVIRDKMLAVARVKDQVKADRQADVERIRETIVKESHRELLKLRETVTTQGDELKKLRQQQLSNQKKDREISSALDRTERTFINEINEECRRTATVLGLTPRKINISSYRGDVKGDPLNGLRSQGRKLITAALANLRACNEELRCHVTEMSQSLESQRSTMHKIQKDKTEALEQLRRKLEHEKLQELDALKERLIQDFHCQQSNLPFSKMATINNNNHHSVNMHQNKHVEVQQDLQRINSSQQHEIERLEKEVARLAVQMSPAVDLETPVPGNILADAYEERALSATREADFANSRADRNGALLSQKMFEMNKLQSTVSHQAKELRQLERAYNQLKSHSPMGRSQSPPPTNPSTLKRGYPTKSNIPGNLSNKRPLSLSAL